MIQWYKHGKVNVHINDEAKRNLWTQNLMDR